MAYSKTSSMEVILPDSKSPYTFPAVLTTKDWTGAICRSILRIFRVIVENKATFRCYALYYLQIINTLKTILFLTFVSFIYFSGCKSQSYSSSQLPDKQIIFGKGGGFSGEVTEYILLENGQMFRSSSFEQEITEIKKIDPQEAAQFFSQMAALQLEKEDFDHPGNMYYFLSSKSPGNQSKVIWGNGEYPVREDIQNFYNSLTKLIHSK